MTLRRIFRIVDDMVFDEAGLLMHIGATILYLSLIMRKAAFCICENKDANQVCGKHAADQHLYFRYIDSTIPLLLKSEIPKL